MNPIRRGYQGKQFRVYDRKNECFFDLTADEFQVILWRSEMKQMEDRKNAGASGDNEAMPEMQLNHVF